MLRLALQLEVLPDEFSLVQLAPDSDLPEWAENASFCSLTRTPDEISIVIPETSVPKGVIAERGWRCLRVKGTLGFDLTGVLAALSTPLAQAGIPLFIVSTYNTDYLLVKSASLEKSLQVLKGSGHTVVPGPSC